MPIPVALAVIAAAVTAAAAGAGVAYSMSTDARVRRELGQVRRVALADAKDGQVVRVTGRVRAVESGLRAPLSGRHCVYYLATAEAIHDRRRRADGGWGEVREERYVDFLIEDASGVARVSMRAPRVAIVRDLHTRSGTFDDANAAEEAFLRRYGVQSTTALGLNRDLRYLEGALEIGEEVTVLGRAHVELAEGRRLVTIEAPPGGSVLVSDDPRVVQRG